MIVAHDTESGVTSCFSDDDPDLPPLSKGLEFLYEAKILVGHNICGYDLMVLKYLFDWEPNKDTLIYDTWILSQVLRYKRGHKHGLEGWGQKLNYPKTSFDEFDKYSKKMLDYCIRDVLLNVKVYEVLVEEIKRTFGINPLFKQGMFVENQFALIEADIRRYGWRFDHEKAQDLVEEIGQRLQEIEDILEPQIGLVCIKKDSKDEYKNPIFKKNGEYAAATCRWFSIEPSNALGQRLVDGPYSRIEFHQGKLSSDKVLKAWLYKIGWQPDEWNYERINGQFVQKSPKLTETSLALLGERGLLISEYNSLANRYGILNGWLKEAEYDGRLHGKMWTIGTPTFRCRHEVVANLPSVQHDKEGNILYKSAGGYGYEMRSLLLPKKGWVIVGADSSGNQMRGLCHYIGNADFTKEVIEGDVHQRNAMALAEFTGGVPNRKLAKPFLYAFLFGGGAGKLALILQGKRSDAVGKQAIARFEDSIPGLGELKERLIAQFEKSEGQFGKGNGVLRGIDGRLIFVDSKHKLLVALLQTLEGLTCKAAVVYFKQKMQEKGIPFNLLLHYHDEFAFECPPEYAEEAKAIAIESFAEAPKIFGVECMSGDGKIGTNYADVH